MHTFAGTTSVTMFNPQQYDNVPPPSSISNLPGFQSIFEPRQPDVQFQPQDQHIQQQQQHLLQHQQQQQQSQSQQQNVAFNPAALSYPNVGPPQSSVSAPIDPTVFYSQAPVPSLQTYSTYPQVQQVTTPISLPGMPPITVSTTISPQQFQNYAHQAPPSSQ